MGLGRLFMRKQRHIQVLLGEYMDTWRACVDTFYRGWVLYLDEGLTERFHHLVEATHKEESRGDDLRRRIEWELYSKALLPESRGDILGLLESVDRLLSIAEWSLMEVSLEKLEVPADLQQSFGDLSKVVYDCCVAVDAAVRALVLDAVGAEDVLKLAERVDALESETDHLERSTIRVIFERDDLQSGDKVMLKEVVRHLAEVADQGEAVANRLMIASVKRKV